MAYVVNGVCLLVLFLTVSFINADDDRGAEVISYDKSQFKSAVLIKDQFVMFFAPWCGHCKRLAPTWNELAKVFNNEKSTVTIAKVDCTIEKELCSDHDVKGYPTLKLFSQKGEEFQRYKGKRSLEALKKFVVEHAEKDLEPAPVEEEPAEIHELTEENFEEAIHRDSFTVVMFYAPWCGDCVKLAPIWQELANSFTYANKVAISNVDCTVSTQLCSDLRIPKYPALYFYYLGRKVDEYRGNIGLLQLQEFVVNSAKQSANIRLGSEEEMDIPLEIEEGAVVKELTDSTFDDAIKEGLIFVKFYAPWCGHCKRLAPIWEELGEAFIGKKVKIARVNCHEYRESCRIHSIGEFPTLAMFQNNVLLENFRGQRTVEALKKFVNQHLAHAEL